MDTRSLEYQRVQSAAMEAQTRQDAALAKRDPHFRPNSYAMPIMMRTLETKASECDTMQELVDASFSGRLRGTVITVLNQRHATKLTR